MSSDQAEQNLPTTSIGLSICVLLRRPSEQLSAVQPIRSFTDWFPAASPKPIVSVLVNAGLASAWTPDWPKGRSDAPSSSVGVGDLEWSVSLQCRVRHACRCRIVPLDVK